LGRAPSHRTSLCALNSRGVALRQRCSRSASAHS
jgi:hypothetical protein